MAGLLLLVVTVLLATTSTTVRTDSYQCGATYERFVVGAACAGRATQQRRPSCGTTYERCCDQVCLFIAQLSSAGCFGDIVSLSPGLLFNSGIWPWCSRII